MTKIMHKCPYCSDELPKSYLYDHIGYAHAKHLIKVKRRLTIALSISITFAAISIGYAVGIIGKFW